MGDIDRPVAWGARGEGRRESTGFRAGPQPGQSIQSPRSSPQLSLCTATTPPLPAHSPITSGAPAASAAARAALNSPPPRTPSRPAMRVDSPPRSRRRTRAVAPPSCRLLWKAPSRLSPLRGGGGRGSAQRGQLGEGRAWLGARPKPQHTHRTAAPPASSLLISATLPHLRLMGLAALPPPPAAPVAPSGGGSYMSAARLRQSSTTTACGATAPTTRSTSRAESSLMCAVPTRKTSAGSRYPSSRRST